MRYSSNVVAPIHCNSPRANAGFKIFEASIAPSAPPAPTKVCNSSINRMTLPACWISSITFFRRSSNSPRYLVPATTVPISKDITRLSFNVSGTSLFTMACAKPSAIAVLPTPGSPISTGLFFVRLLNTSITRVISLSRPITGSNVPSLAMTVKSRAKLSKVGVLFDLLACAFLLLISGFPKAFTTCARALVIFKSRFAKTLAATPSFSRIKPNKICSVPTKL